MYAASATISSTFLIFVVVVVISLPPLPPSSSSSVTAFSTMNMNMNNSEIIIRKVLINTKTIALIGASIKPNRPSNYVMKYLLDNGYNVIPVNPGLADGSFEIYGQKVYNSLSSIPTCTNIDMVDIFRNSAAVPSIVDEILKMNSNDNDIDIDIDNDDLTIDDDEDNNKQFHNIKSIWMQVGVINEDAALKAKKSGLDVIMNACPKIEIPKLNIRTPTIE
jgi:predicted CoA-binding protein